MKRVLFLSVLMVVAGASSASAQESYDAFLGRMALDDIARETRLLRWAVEDIGVSSYVGYSGGGYLPTFQAYRRPTKKQVKHFYRAEHAAAVRAGTATRIRTTVVAHKGPRF